MLMGAASVRCSKGPTISCTVSPVQDRLPCVEWHAMLVDNVRQLHAGYLMCSGKFVWFRLMDCNGEVDDLLCVARWRTFAFDRDIEMIIALVVGKVHCHVVV